MSMSRRKGVLNDRSGVSPVIGVILMVAVTVIVAAVIGATTLGMTDRVGERPPQAQFEVKQVDNHTVYDEEREDDIQFGAMIEIKHTNGEDVDKENIRVTVDGEPAHIATEKTEAEISNEDKYNYKKNFGDSQHPVLAQPWFDTETIRAGDTAQLVTAGSYLEDNGVTADPLNEDRLVYRAEDDDTGPHNTYDDIYANDGSMVNIEDHVLKKGQTVRVIWVSDGESQTLVEHEIE